MGSVTYNQPPAPPRESFLASEPTPDSTFRSRTVILSAFRGRLYPPEGVYTLWMLLEQYLMLVSKHRKVVVSDELCRVTS